MNCLVLQVFMCECVYGDLLIFCSELFLTLLLDHSRLWVLHTLPSVRQPSQMPCVLLSGGSICCN